MKRRNPPASRRRAGDARTPGQMLFNMLMETPLTSERRIKLITTTAQTLLAEKRTGLWTDKR